MDKLIKLIFPPFPDNRVSVGLLALRLLTGIGIAMHGYPKITNIAGFSEGIGVPIFLGAMAAITEFGGGLLLAIGALTPLVSFFLVGNMAYAAFFHFSKGDPFLLKPTGQGTYSVGYEFASLYLVAFFALLLSGPGKFAIDYLWARKWRE